MTLHLVKQFFHVIWPVTELIKYSEKVSYSLGENCIRRRASSSISTPTNIVPTERVIKDRVKHPIQVAKPQSAYATIGFPSKDYRVCTHVHIHVEGTTANPIPLKVADADLTTLKCITGKSTKKL